jgi:hypothetical protein
MFIRIPDDCIYNYGARSKRIMIKITYESLEDLQPLPKEEMRWKKIMNDREALKK